jgi:hypothetical protein
VGFIGETRAFAFVETLTTGPASYGGGGMYARGDGESYTASAGDEWIMPFGGYDQLQDDSDAEFTLILNALSGSAQVRVLYGSDPEYDRDPATCTNDAGTLTVDAGDTLFPLPAWSVPLYHSGDEQHLAIVQVISGSVELDSIRLRIWPPGGALGGWSGTITPTSSITYPVGSGYRQEPSTDLAPTSDPPGLTPPDRVFRPADNDRAQALSDAQAYARGDFAATTEATVRIIDTTSAYGDPMVRAAGGATARRHVGEAGTGDPIGSVAEASVYGEKLWMNIGSSAGSPPAGVEGVDWQRHPDRPDTEADYRKEELGPPVLSWAQPTVTAEIGSGLALVSGPDTYWFHLPGSYYLKVTGLDALPSSPHTALLDWTPISSAGGIVPVVVPAAVSSDQGFVVEFDMPPPSPAMLLEMSHEILFGELPAVPAYDVAGDPDNPQLRTGSGSIEVYAGKFDDFYDGRTGYDPLAVTMIAAPYRVWVPTARVRKLRQLHRDDGRGGTPPAAFSGASRARTGRAFGYT